MPNRLVFFMASFLILTSVIILMTSQGSSGANNGKKFQACAVCKYQRRRCKQDCIFLPYFPADRYEEFLNVNRLFGVRNVGKMLEQPMTQGQRDDAIKSIKFQSNIRSKFPVHGCLQVIWDLQNQIALHEDELHRIKTLNSRFTSASNPAAADFFNPAATFFDPSAAVESFATELRNPSRNLTVNNDDFTRFPINDDTVDFFNGGGHSGNFPYGECVTETRPFERANNNAQQYWFSPDSNNLGSSPAPENNANNIDDSDADVQAFMQMCGVPRNNDNRNPPNDNNRIPPNQLQLLDPLNDDEPSFSKPDSNNLGLSPAPENDFHSGAAVQAFMQSGGTPRNNDNRNPPNYDNRIPPNQLQLEDLLNDDDEPSFSQTNDKRYVFQLQLEDLLNDNDEPSFSQTDDKRAESTTKDDDFPIP